MEDFGHLYATCRLEHDPDGQVGLVHCNGSGFWNGEMLSAEGNGYWDLIDGVITVQLPRWSRMVNLEGPRFTPGTPEMTLGFT